METKVLDATGHYSHEGELLSMKEALDLGFMNFESYREVEIQHQSTYSSQSQISSSSTSEKSVEQITENIRLVTTF